LVLCCKFNIAELLSMKGIVCTYLYPLSDERTLKSNTFAVRELVEGAVREGLNVVAVIKFQPLLTRKGIFLPKHNVINGLSIYSVPKIGIRHTYSKFLTKYILEKLGFSGSYDFAIAHSCTSFEAMYRTLSSDIRYKYLVIHGSDFKDRALLRDCTSKANAILCRSAPLRRMILDLESVKCKGIIYSGIESELFCDRQPDDINVSDGIKIVIASVFVERKNIIQTLGAIASVRSSGYEKQVDIYGDGPLRTAIASKIKSLGLSEVVRLHGFVTRSKVIEGMKSAHLFIMPSAPETFGQAYLEAMASGCIVIGHRAWGIDGIVEDQLNGYLVNSASEIEIKSKILKYLSLSHEERIILHKECSQTCRNFTYENSIKNYYETFSALNTEMTSDNL